MIEIVEAPTFRRADFETTGKHPGLSAIVRLRNEEDFAEASLKSILPFFDEIVIVFNDCIDRTPEIVAEFARQNPNQVRAFHYVPHVFPPGSEQHRRLPASSVHSLVHYYNFTLSKASYQVRCKWDGDQIAEPQSFERMVRQLRDLQPGTPEWWLSPWRWGYWWYTGVNLWDAQQRLWVTRARPFIGNKHDHGFFPAARWVVFKHHPHVEYLFTRLLAHKFIGCLFFHLKAMKRDRGVGNFRFDLHPDSVFRPLVERNRGNPALMTIDELRAVEPAVRQLPAPVALGIHPIVTR